MEMPNGSAQKYGNRRMYKTYLTDPERAAMRRVMEKEGTVKDSAFIRNALLAAIKEAGESVEEGAPEQSPA